MLRVRRSTADKPIHVLLIEDDPEDARLLRETLVGDESVSLDIQHVGALDPGLERVSKDGVDVVLLDLALPDSQGLDTFIRIDAPAPEVPIVVLAGPEDEALAAQAVREGAQGSGI